MLAILTAVFQATIGLIVDTARDKAAEKLKDGDVTDQKFRELVVRELNDIKSKLDGLSRKDMLASMSFFKEGIEILYEVFRMSIVTSRGDAEARTRVGDASSASACHDTTTLALVERKSELKLADLDDSATKLLAKAKKRFEDSRRKATEAFNNESLKLPDRLLAMKYRVMATILESIDSYMEAFPACKVCLSELHALAEVRNNFKVQVNGGFMSLFNKDGRIEVISSVCQINEVINEVFHKRSTIDSWPYIDTEGEIIDPLQDSMVSKDLRDVGLKHYCQPWSFGQDGEGEARLKNPICITTNSIGDGFIVTDIGEKYRIKVFDTHGKFRLTFDTSSVYFPRYLNEIVYTCVSTDREYVYMLITYNILAHDSDAFFKSVVVKFDKHWQPTLLLGGFGNVSLLAVNDKGNTFFTSNNKMEFVHYENSNCVSHGPPFLNVEDFDNTAANIRDILVAGDRFLVITLIDRRHPFHLHFFTENGKHLKRIELDLDNMYNGMAFDREHGSGSFISSDAGSSEIRVHSYTLSGDFVHEMTPCLDHDLNPVACERRRHVALAKPRCGRQGIAVTPDGRIAVIDSTRGKVVIQEEVME